MKERILREKISTINQAWKLALPVLMLMTGCRTEHQTATPAVTPDLWETAIANSTIAAGTMSAEAATSQVTPDIVATAKANSTIAAQEAAKTATPELKSLKDKVFLPIVLIEEK